MSQIGLFDEDQLSMFEDLPGGKDIINETFLNIVKDDQIVQMSINELFDITLFDELKAVSFVASPNFFFSTTKNFKNIALILGIEDGSVADSFATGIAPLLDIPERVKFFNSLPIDVKENIVTNKFSIRYPKKGNPIHSKIYLLKGKDVSRVIIGSANFTETAFGNKKQYEELLVFDNSPLYEIYENRFNDIFTQTVDYIPEMLKKQPETEKVWIADPEMMKDILIDDLTRQKVIVQLSEEEMEEIKLTPDKLEVEKEEATQFKQIIEVITKKDKKSNSFTLLPVASLKQKSVAIKSILSKTSKKSEELDHRFQLVYNNGNNMLLTTNHGINIDDGESELIPFSKPITDIDILRENLTLINRFVDAYELFTARTDLKNQSRIFEIILYAFMSTYIWNMRDHYASEEGRESVRRHFPPFMIIAGRSMSGKTSALEFIGMLLGNTNPYFAYEQVKDSSVIWDYFHSSNVNPILIDEIDPKFFTSTAAKKGERLIKYISNEIKGQHPVMIGTTNATGFDVTAQTSMRIYYLQIDNTFQKEAMADSSKYLSEIMSKINSSLFQDFTYRIGKRLQDGHEFYKTDDFLAIAREVFVQYYKECEMEIPKWFPMKKFNDYDERGKFIWRELYRSHKQVFDIRDDNTILIKIEEFGDRTNKERANKINFLPPECIIEDSPVLVINKEIFFKFIEMSEKEEKSFVQKIKSLFSKREQEIDMKGISK
ncbi:phospholipase D family protein [Neobacillus sp. D3-1R]|uniref:phospholipase D family protein n=1 Tax=Neobacillus sp. D3-1R TaxID=3445778 RepID=UPI003F9FE643